MDRKQKKYGNAVSGNPALVQIQTRHFCHREKRPERRKLTGIGLIVAESYYC